MSKTFCYWKPTVQVLSAGTPCWLSYLRWQCRLETKRSIIFLLEGYLARGINIEEWITRWMDGRFNKTTTSLVQEYGRDRAGALSGLLPLPFPAFQ
jgi:hypothetical protein